MTDTPDTLTVNGTDYVRHDLVGGPGEIQIQIVVIEGRWNVIGKVRADECGNLTITSASVIRYWGTTKGLGQIAADGPTSKTILDPTPTLRVPAGKVLLTIDVDAGKWSL